MEHNVSEALVGLLVPLDALTPLEHNHRVGNVTLLVSYYTMQ